MKDLALSEAIVRYYKHGEATWPQHDDEAVAPELRENFNEVEGFANRLHPDWTKLDLAGSGRWASNQISKRFPYLTQEALDALAWACTSGWK